MTTRKPAKRATKKSGARRRVHYAPDSPKAIAFCERFLVHLNQAKAAEEAGYSKRRARATGCDLMHMPEIQQRIQKLMDARAKATGIEADAVIERFWSIATADPNELVEYRRTCCRYCYGANHDYQRSERELAAAREAWEQRAEKKADDVFTLAGGDGGTGWDPRKDPNPACPECFGAGREDIHFKDTRKLSAGARMLYAGVKTTKDGIEVKMQNQLDALVSVARHLKLFTDVVKHEGLDKLADAMRAAEERVANAG